MIMQKQKTQTIKEVMQISSGTMALLFNTREYQKIDKIQSNIVEFVENSSKVFRSWMDAVVEFEAMCKKQNIKL